MITLLIIADDFTGALDTGVQFASSGTTTRVVTDPQYDFSSVEEDVSVLVVNAETRHLAPDEAYKTVREIARNAAKAKVAYFYKKTDSALRGNIGSELQAMLDGTGNDSIHFIPALPSMNRVTINGVHYIDGIPVAESVFGRDMFEPVRYSSIKEIIALQTEAPVHHHAAIAKAAYRPGIHIYDAAAEKDLAEIARQLKEDGQLALMAGCSGFAATLPELLELPAGHPRHCPIKLGILIACGSTNPITQAQLDEAEQRGFTRYRFTPEQKLDPAWPDSAESTVQIKTWFQKMEAGEMLIVDANDISLGETQAYADQLGLNLSQLRIRISTMIGTLLKRLLDCGADGTILITGGDTLHAFMRQIGVDELIPDREVAPGVVLSRFLYRGKHYNVISKSGGFGSRTLFSDLARKICSEEYREERIC